MVASSSFFALLALVPFALASRSNVHTEDVVPNGVPGNWFHDDNHPVHALFKRGTPPTDGVSYPQVGSPTWAAAYPESTPDPSQMPKEWLDALNNLVAAGKIPNIPIPTLAASGPVYPSGTDPNGAEVCSAYYKCRMPDDIWDAPDGVLGVGFDDGPYQGSPTLYPFLTQHNIRTTHYMIGVYILQNPDLFTQAFATMGGDIAVHTWTHPSMSTLSNEDVVAQLGWTIEIIHNSTGGRIPRYWRPPTGDMDNRVRAIASEVFGLTPIMWNQDTEDWSLTTGGTTMEKINASMTQWLNGPKSPGLIILEHELSNMSAQAFIDAYPLMMSQGWKLQSQATLNGTSVYLNSNDDNSPVTAVPGAMINTPPPASNTNTNTPGGSSTKTSTTPKNSQTGSGSQDVHDNSAASFVTSRGGLMAAAGALLFALVA